MVLTDAAQAEWMRQWRGAAQALAEEHRVRLAALTKEEALAASEAVLSLAGSVPLSAARRTTSGFVQQQALFQQARTR
jgi:hypothetical protein